MPKRNSFKQSYTVNGGGYQAATSGTRFTNKTVSANGRFLGGRQGFTNVDDNGAKSGTYSGRFISRKQMYRDIRTGLGLAAG